MDFSTSSDMVDLQIQTRSRLLTSIHNAAIYTLSLLFLFCYEYSKTSVTVGMLIAYMVIGTVLNAINYALSITLRHTPMVIALIAVAFTWYLHRLIKEHDRNVTIDAVTAAGLVAIEHFHFLEYGPESGCEGEGSSTGQEAGFSRRTRPRAITGGLDTDVWQGGRRVMRSGRTGRVWREWSINMQVRWEEAREAERTREIVQGF